MNLVKFIFSVLAFASTCLAQNALISGTVYTPEGYFMAGASVALEKGGQTTYTDVNGEFILTGNSVKNSQSRQVFPSKLSANIHNSVLQVNLGEKTSVQIVNYTLQGKTVSMFNTILDPGFHSIPLHQKSSGIYLYKVKAGNSEIFIKDHSIGQGSRISSTSFQKTNTFALLKKASATTDINDVVVVKKNGYLNYRQAVYNSDTQGLKIGMIACDDTVTDADGNVYRTVRIGNQVWTVENLRTTKYGDKVSIPFDSSKTNWTNATTPKFCYYNNTSNVDSMNKFGALYNWYVVNPQNPHTIAPTGWHVSTESDWDTLQKYFISQGYSEVLAKTFAAKADWYPSTKVGAVGNDLTINNMFGFSALPGGHLDKSGFSFIGSYGYWWSLSGASTIRSLGIGYNDNSPYRDSANPCSGLSVRLLKDSANAFPSLAIGQWKGDTIKDPDQPGVPADSFHVVLTIKSSGAYTLFRSKLVHASGTSIADTAIEEGMVSVEGKIIVLKPVVCKAYDGLDGLLQVCDCQNGFLPHRIRNTITNNNTWFVEIDDWTNPVTYAYMMKKQ